MLLIRNTADTIVGANCTTVQCPNGESFVTGYLVTGGDVTAARAACNM
jgi:hypothetical protein